MQRLRAFLCALLSVAILSTAQAQGTLPSMLRVQGLRSVGHLGAFKAAAFLPDGTLVLLYDQGDGLRLLKTDAGASTLLAEAHLGAAQDTGVALATDPQGNIFVGGTSASGQLAGTAGAAFSAPADSSVNSFVSRFDPSLHLTFLSFLGAGNTALTGVAVTGDAVFATGITFSAALPTTAGAVQPAPPSGNAGNTGDGFVERLSADGTTVVYATYLSGSGGSTSPSAITADALDHAYVAGSTSSPNFPSVAALQPTMLGTSAGFLAELTPTGDSFAFSTFVAGAGLASIALDASTGNLLLTGNLSPGQFPLANVAAPIANTPYQSIIRLSGDGQTLLDAALLLPGSRSAITAGPHSTAWITGSLTAPATGEQADAGVGDGYLLHLTGADEIDALFRIGGHPANAPEYASLQSTPGPPALSADATAVLVPSTVMAKTDPSLAGSQTFDLGLAMNANALLPSTASDLLPTTCSPGLPCSGTGGLLTLFGTGNGGTSLLLSDASLPVVTVRNAGPNATTGLQVSTTGFGLAIDCPPAMPVGAQCGALLTGSGPGSVSASAANASQVVLPVPAVPSPSPESLSLNAAELNFGIVAVAASPVTRTFTVTNLGTLLQTFASSPAATPSSAPYSLVEAASTCDGPPSAHTLGANSSCAVTVALSASSSAANDSTAKASWTIGAQSIPVSGFTQAASLSVSASTIDFGPSLGTSTTRLPRFLYLSNASPFPIAHTSTAAPPNQPFTVNDDCPTTLQPNSVCQIGLWYTQTSAPALDTLTLALDSGLSVLVTGETIAAAPPANTLAPLPLTVSPATVQFVSPVPVSGVSTEVQVVEITNTSATVLALNASLLGDFLLQNTCPALLSAGATCDLGLQFAPSQASFREGLLTLSAGPGYDVIAVPISGTGEPLVDLGSELDLGETPVGEPVTAWFQVEGSLPNLTLAVSGAGFGVAILPDDGSGHGTLAAGAFSASVTAQCTRCWVGLQFLPTAPGAAGGVLQVSTAGTGNPYVVALRAFGIATEGLLLSPAEGSFGAIPRNGTSVPVTFVLVNALPNAAPVRIQSVHVTGDFQSLGNSGPQVCTGTLAPSAACGIQVAFSPTQLGLRSGTLTVVTDGGTATAALSGTGTAADGLAISPTALTFTQAAQETVTLTNTGPDPLTLLAPTVTGSAFSAASTCATLAPGQSCTATVSFQPRTSPTSGTLSLPVTHTDATGQTLNNVYAVPLTGSGTVASAGLAVFPSQADFGSGSTGAVTQVRQFSLTNTSSAPLTISLAASRNFPLAAPPACATLAAGASCSFAVVFLPETAGPLTGTIVATATAADGGSAGQTLAYLQGYGVNSAAILISDGTGADLPLNFGQVASGQTASQALALTNTGNDPVTIRRLETTAPFAANSTCTASLAPGATCTVTLTYSPVYQVDPSATLAPRTDRGTLLIESDAATSADTVYLSGVVRPSVQATDAAALALPAYTLSASALTFPNTPPGARSATQSITLSNSGSAPVNVTGILTPPDFAATTDCTLLLPGASCSLEAAFTPQAGSAPSLHMQTLEIQSDAADALESVSFLGSSFANPLQVTPAPADFDSVLLGATAQLSLTLTNGSTLPVSLGGITITGDYALGSTDCPAAGGALPGGQSCTLTIRFNPLATGPRSGTLTIASPDLQQPLAVPLTGIGIAGHLQPTPASLDFGTVNLNTQSALTLHLANTGTAALSGISATLSGPDATLFAITSNCGASLPVGAVCDLQVTFTPLQTGPRLATLTLTSSDPTGPLLVPLAGTGAQAPGFALTVNGESTAAATLHSGADAAFPLVLTPQGGYATPVALSCTAVHAAPNTTCTLSGAQITLTAGPGSGSATIATLSGLSPASPLPWTWILLAPGFFLFRRPSRRRPFLHALIGIAALALAASSLSGCGGNIGVTGYPYTPPGTYVYQVTASSTVGPPLASTVTLTVTVQ